VYECCTTDDVWKGKEWYTTANKIIIDIGKRYNKTPIVSIGVCAALSPQSSWDWNLINLDLYFQGIHKHTGHQIAKAKLIESTTDDKKISDILNGRKTVAFFNNLLSPYANEYVCIDRHNLSVAGIDKNSCTPKQYDFLAECYKECASDLDLKALHLQAITWIYWRKAKKIK
jgi:hypothetical protein